MERSGGRNGYMRDYINFQTPDWVCEEMLKLIPSGIKTILEPTPGAGNILKAINSHYLITAPDDFWTVTGRFDAVVMNPPFSPMAMGYKILYRCMEMTDIIIALMPWLTLINSEQRTKDITAWGLKSVIHIPRKAFAGARVQCCIIFMVKGYNGRSEFLSI